MRFLADENFPGIAVTALRSAGHNVRWVRIDAPGAIDAEVLAWAAREQRITLTFDKDFGELARNARLPHASGVILFRIRMVRGGEDAAKLAALVASREDWAGHVSVLEPGRLRMRPLRNLP